MSLPLSREVKAILKKADELAGEVHSEPTTGHLLAAMLEVPNQGANLLADYPLESTPIREQLERMGSEQAHLVQRVQDRSRRLASGARSEAVTSLHLLAALTRESGGHAYRLLDSCGVDIGAMRTSVMSYATSSRPVPRRVRTPARNDGKGGESRSAKTAHSVRTAEVGTGTPIGFHPSLGVGTRRNKETPPTGQQDTDQQRPQRDDDAGKTDSTSSPMSAKRRPRRLTDEEVRLNLDAHPGINRSSRRRPAEDETDEPDETRSAADAAPAERRDEPDEGGQPQQDEASRRAEALEDARRTTRDLAARLFSGEDTPEQGSAEPPEFGESIEEGDEELAEEYRLDAERYPNLSEYGRNLTRQAALGRIDSVIGRESEIAQLIDILGKRRSNNPLLVGAPGVGKTAIVEGLARQFVDMKRRGAPMGDRVIVELEMSRILSGTHLRGAFSERLLGIKDEVADAGGDVIVFLDEIHMWMDAGAGGDGGDAAGELKTALARGRFPCIGATTNSEYRQFVEADPAFERRFQHVDVEEPDEETALRIIEGVRTHYERHHGVKYTPGALAASVTLADRYIHDRQLPDKAIGVLDLAGSRAARRGERTVDRDILSAVIADMASIPRERLTGDDAGRFLQMESFLSEQLVGHDEIVETVAELLRRNYAGFRGDRPIGSLLFLGPTGVGKTELVKVLADFLFHDREAIVQVDMSEFMESHSVSRLIGSPPGYVGHEQGGQLTEQIRQRPYQVVLLDEIEKAHPDVLNLLLQLFEEGQLTDGKGRSVDFSNALVVMTSNLGAGVFDDSDRELSSPSIGFSRRDESMGPTRRDETRLRQEVLDAAGEHFSPELWNRIDEKLVFLPLSRDEIARIAELQLANSGRKLLDESDIEMKYDPAVVDHLIENGGYDPDYGARPMRQTIQKLVEGQVARAILSGTVSEGETIVVAVEDGNVVVQPE